MHRTGGEPTTRPLEATDLSAVVDVVAAAFADYPYWRWLVPDAGARAAVLPSYYRADLAPMLADSTGVDVDGVLVAVAIWAPSTSWAAVADAPSTGAAGEAAPRMRRALDAMAAMAPDEPHWYLDVLAVLPHHQGRGLGRVALAPGLSRADAEDAVCYLETGRTANVEFYRGAGFTVRGECDVPGESAPSAGATTPGELLHLWGMWRAPQPVRRRDHL